jgi:hypothetical protein
MKKKTLADHLAARKVYEDNLATFKTLKGKGEIEENSRNSEEPKLKEFSIPWKRVMMQESSKDLIGITGRDYL